MTARHRWPIRFCRWLWGLRLELLSDTLLLGGTAAMLYGLAQVHVPGAWGLGGLIVALAGWRLTAKG